MTAEEYDDTRRLVGQLGNTGPGRALIRILQVDRETLERDITYATDDHMMHVCQGRLQCIRDLQESIENASVPEDEAPEAE